MKSLNKKLVPPLAGVLVSTILLAVVLADEGKRNPIDFRNHGLESKLATCDMYGYVGGDVRVGYTWGGDVIFDVRRARDDARLIDPLHLFFQFGAKIEPMDASRIWMAAAGRAIFSVEKSQYSALSREYISGGQIVAFRLWPQSLKRPSGDQAFQAWSGGILDVLNRQLEDLNKALREWLAGVAT